MSGDVSLMKNSTDFKPYLESKQLKIKEGWELIFKENSVIFEDGSEEKVDLVIECIGYIWYWQHLFDEHESPY